MPTFEELKLNRQLLNAIAEAGYQEPTEIQAKAIPLILAGHDILGIAQTGTGKTAAYTLPLLMKLKFAQGTAPRALILAPTRELCLQIKENVQNLAKYTDLRVVAIFGGKGIKPQLEEVRQGVDILIATPGRFMDIYFTNELPTKEIRTLVLDEADRMMDMGFMPQIRKILEIIPAKKRQNLLFSATMPEKVVRLSEEFLEFPVRVEITPQATPAETVEQFLYQVPNFRTKIELLQYFLSQENAQKVIIFTKTKENANNIYKFIARKFGENNVRVIHANKDQNARFNAIEAFKNGMIRFLVATDVAARGIDISQVSHVINFDVPLLYEEYVHRIGRTGRAKHTGIAITFANEAEMYHIAKIEQLIKQAIPKVEIPTEVKIYETPFEEKQAIARQIDAQKRKENPDFQGAFHEKKVRRKKKSKK
ncbi:MAG: DEAD/DEAH box helicase [Raineya sp.]|nr:DEAD/DEAH box helicase [Raineya sp.]MDW8295839.1 DEAD/DEAH box helicase [Raineya sp.]